MSESGITVLNKEEQTVEDSLKTLVKTLEAIDWKLWELYQTAQRVEKYLGINEEKEDEK